MIAISSRIKALFVALAALTAVTAAAPASAQFEGRGSDMRLTHARCLVERDADQVAEFMNSTPDSSDERSLGRSLFRGNARCLDDTNIASLNVSKLRGALAEVLVLSDPQRLAVLENGTFEARAAQTRTGRGLFVEYGRCLAASHPEDAIEFIRTPHSSSNEMEALSAMDDVQIACLPSGTNSPMALADVRDHIAWALYEFSS